MYPLKKIILLLFLLFSGLPLLAQGGTRGGLQWGEAERGELRVMWYNVENLFHPDDDGAGDGNEGADEKELAVDDEFRPEGVRAWTYFRYRDKLTKLAKVIVATGRWQPPELVGLCEVENGQVLEDLIAHPILAPYDYAYLHRDGPDHRGMEVACLFRPERFDVTDWLYVEPVEGEGFDQTREMLYLQGSWGRKDSLELFLVHFISRYRGSGQTANYRRKQAERLVDLMDSLSCGSEGKLVLAAGDFNDAGNAWSLEPFQEFDMLPSGDETSYKYRGVWSRIDFFLLKGEAERYRIDGSVFKHPGLLIPDLTYGGLKPFRTYEGYAYSGGYSDHLPVLLDISRGRIF